MPDAPFSQPAATSTATRTADVDDLHIGAKIRFLSETAGRPAMAVRFSTRLPNAEQRVGPRQGHAGFHAALIVGKTIQSVRVVANVGLLILGDPTQAGGAGRSVDLQPVGRARDQPERPRSSASSSAAPTSPTSSRPAPRIAACCGSARATRRAACASMRGILLGLTPRDPEIRLHRRLHLGLQRLQGALMLSIAKAHAYGNDFLFVPAEQVEGLRLDELSRRLCDRHTGIGGDGVIYYTIAPDGTAQMKLINTDGSPSELSGNGLRCLAALVLHRREQPRPPPITEVRVDTDAGWKTLALISRQGGRYTFRAAMGQPERVAEETLDAGGETLTVTTLAIGNPQCVALMTELPDLARFNRLGPALATHPRFPQGTNVEFAVVEAPDRVRILIWERGVGPTHASGHRRVRVGDRRDRARRRRARHRGDCARRHAARRVARRRGLPDGMGRSRVRRPLGALDADLSDLA